MPTDDQQVLVVGTASAPAHFTVPGNGQIQPKAVRAVYDGSSATSSFIPVLQIVSDAGIKVVECVGSQIAAGGSAAVSWFPWLGTNQTTVIGPGAGCVYFVGPPSGNAALDTGAIQAALDSLPATGGIVQLCRGTYQLASSGITIAGRCQLAGHGRFNTTLEYAFSTGTAITVTTTNTAWMLRDFSLSNTSGITPTAGSGVTVSGNSSYWQIIGMSVIGFWNCVVVTTSNSWTMNTTLLQDFVNHGIEISNSVNGDQGDFTFQDCHFFTGPTNTGATNAISFAP